MTTKRILLTLSLLFFFNGLVSGQTVFETDREAYKLNNFIYEFNIFNDSTTYIKGHYEDFSVYFIYKGRLKQTSDTLFEFNYKPIIEFRCNKRSRSGMDSIYLNILQIDATLFPLTNDVKVENEKTVELISQRTIIYLKGATQNTFSLDTKFIDPLTLKKITMNINPTSEPVLSYFGEGDVTYRLELSIVNNLLTIYPDHQFISDKDAFIKVS